MVRKVYTSSITFSLAQVFWKTRRPKDEDKMAKMAGDDHVPTMNLKYGNIRDVVRLPDTT